MKKTLVLNYGLLILLTISTSLISRYTSISNVAVALIIAASAVKFILVAFQFMELKTANTFWKMSLIFVLFLIIVPVLLLLNRP